MTSIVSRSPGQPVKLALILAAIALLGSAFPAGAGCAGQGTSKLHATLADYTAKYRNLILSRGLEPPSELGAQQVEILAAKIQSQLQSGEALAVFDQDARDLCIVLFRNGRNPLATTVLNGAADFAAALDRFASASGINRSQTVRAPRPRGVTQIEEPPAEYATPAESDSALAIVSQALFPAAVQKALKGTRSLYVVPTAEIGSVPFAALPFGGGQLIDKVTVKILPNLFESAPGFIQLDSENVPKTMERYWPESPSGPPAIIGDPGPSDDPDWEFPELPGAREEAIAVAALFDTPALLGAAATHQAVLEALGRRPEFIYIAAHGVASASDPLRGSFIKLADSRLTAEEIQNLKLPHVPVFLSACQTGLGRADAGGVIGLARAFTIAGAGPVIMSLWAVRDDDAKAIMVETIRGTARLGINEALRNAMLNARQQTNGEIGRWAAFAVFGQ